MPFLLDLVRHGEALPTGPGGDPARPLSPAGRKAIERLAARLAGEGWRPDVALSSPLLRARQTTELLLGNAGVTLSPVFLDDLFPDVEPGVAAAAIAAACAGHEHALVVAHQPLCGRLAAWLTGEADGGFTPGMLVRVEAVAGLERGTGVARVELRP